MQTGILGGTFDPIHCGHIHIAAATRNALQLDRMLLLPAGDPPHKSHPTDKFDRYRMVELACAGEEGLCAADDEIKRDGTTYTVDTLHRLHEAYPDDEWYYLIGEDTLEVLDSWRNFPEVAHLCTFVVVGRGDAPVNIVREQALTKQYGARFITLNISGPDISSTEIRSRTAAGEDISGLVPPAVREYIVVNGLYLCGMSRQAVIERLRQSLKPSRFDHTLGVARTAKRLAERFGVDPMRAELAGLLHDCAKYLSSDELRSMCAQMPDVESEELRETDVLHAPVGSVIARDVFGVRDPAILSAIRKHTIGGAEMSPLDALIYTADFIEPGRRPFEGLEEARLLAETDIYGAMLKCASLTQEYLRSEGKDAHTKTKMMMQKYTIQQQEV